jgi:acetyl esterase/lipase
MNAVEVIPYKTTPQATLNLHVFRPDGPATCAIVFFFCGGWNGFHIHKFFPQSAYFASRGAICINAEVRTIEHHGTRPHECVIDAKSAVRFVRAHANEWGFPVDKVVSAGGSAAGHVSLSMAILKGFEDEREDKNVSAVSNLSLAYNPAVLPPLAQVTSSEERITARLEKFGGEEEMNKLSPTQHVRACLPPVLLLHGDADDVTPLSETEYFHQQMRAAGNDCELKVYAGGGHGFFNYKPGGNPYFTDTTRDADNFLVAHGFLSGTESISDFNYDGEC